MKTYREECQKLLDWATAEDAKIDADLEASGFMGRDGPEREKYKKVSKEYYKRLSELKKKYGIETATQEKEPVTAAKGRTFGQIIQPPV